MSSAPLLGMAVVGLLSLAACGESHKDAPMNSSIGGAGAGAGGSAPGSVNAGAGSGGSSPGSGGGAGSAGSAGTASAGMAAVVSRTLAISDRGGCAVNPESDVECWGFLDDGAPAADSAEFTSVSVFSDGEYACALDVAGRAKCWSMGSMYEVVEDGPLDQVSLGLDYGCAIRSSDRSVTCWTTTGTMASPVLQPPKGEFATIATGDFNACGTLVDGTLSCWGKDLSGALDTPQGRFEQVATGEFSSCAVGSAGNACWGGSPPLAPPADRFEVLSAAAGYACGILEDGSIVCWGDAPAGSVPEGPFRALSTATGHACAVRMDGTLTCWGKLSVSQVPPEGLVVK